MKSIANNLDDNLTCLSDTKEGQTVKIHSIHSGLGAKGRLFELGIYPGEKVKIVKNGRFGPVMLLVKDSTFMLGREMTKKIFVK